MNIFNLFKKKPKEIIEVKEQPIENTPIPKPIEEIEPVEEMPQKPIKLTPKREKFAALVASGETQSDAYREAYNTENYKEEVIHVKASQLAADDKVKIRIAEHRERFKDFINYNAKVHFDELEELKELALTPTGKDGSIDVKAGIKATELKGKLTNLYTDKTELSTKGNQPIIQFITKTKE